MGFRQTSGISRCVGFRSLRDSRVRNQKAEQDPRKIEHPAEAKRKRERNAMIGQIISQYKIVEKLGEGGMGIVYKAHDTKLDRIVALKFLPHHLTANEAEKARFLQEARAASALNHPNVCTIFDIKVEQGQQFIVMEYVEGKTLRDALRETLKPETAVGYATQIGEALAEAHAKGIVHRDVKAENIMVTAKGQIKVMDFGLAKLKGSLKLTRTSSTVGTLAYMAPEQIQGGEVDARSDIFSFGIVLYEMLTGKLPFRGEHEAAMMYSILNEEPTPADTFRPELSGDHLHILNKALEKDPAERYQHVEDMVVDLRRLKKQSSRVSRASMSHGTMQPDLERKSISSEPPGAKPTQRDRLRTYGIVGAGLIIVAAAALLFFRPWSSGPGTTDRERKMIAVLPFENFGSADQEYFADGLTEEVTNRLSGLSGLGVIARTSAMQYKKTDKTLLQIGNELGVGYVLQGTVRWGKSPDGATRIRVSPALVKVSDGTQVWSQPYDAVFSDVFKMQSDIASQVAGALGVTLLQPERESLKAAHTENSEAYDFYLRGNEYLHRSYREQDFQIGIQMLEKAVGLDPRFALAHAKLGEAHSAMYWFHYEHTKERLAKAKAEVDEALRIDPGLPEAHASLGYYYYWGYLDYNNALKEFAVVQKSRPNDTRVLLGIGSVQRRQGKMDLAAASMSHAAELDPRSEEIAFNASQTYALLRNYPEAGRFLDRAIEIAPDLPGGYIYKAFYYLISSADTKKAKEVMRQALDVKGMDEDRGFFFMRVQVEMCDANYREALSLVQSGPKKPYDDQFQFVPRDQLLATIYGLMGQHDLEHRYYDSARVGVEGNVRTQPEDARFHSALGIVYAGLGRKQEAIREGKRGVELLPVSKEAWRGTYRVRDLAVIYAMVGEQSAALDLLEDLLSTPSEITSQFLRIDPTWIPLRNNPRFQKLLTQYQ